MSFAHGRRCHLTLGGLSAWGGSQEGTRESAAPSNVCCSSIGDDMLWPFGTSRPPPPLPAWLKDVELPAGCSKLHHANGGQGATAWSRSSQAFEPAPRSLHASVTHWRWTALGG